MDRFPKLVRSPAIVAAMAIGSFATIGCSLTPTHPTENPAPRRMPAPSLLRAGETYEQSLTGGRVFTMYCSACHEVWQNGHLRITRMSRPTCARVPT